MRFGNTAMACVLLALVTPARADGPTGGAPPSAVVRTHDAAAARVIQALLTDEAYWDGAWTRTYSGRSYDEIRMKEVANGFLPRISGEGGRDISRAVVEDVIFLHFDELPKHLAPAELAMNLGRGHDPRVGADYNDSWFFLDVPFMYIEFTWRLYRTRTPDGRTLLWFELLSPEMAGPETWARYQARIDAARATVDRKAVFGSIVQPTSAYGLFVVEPGRRHETRVTFVASVVFGAETGWLASYASQIALFLRTALAQAFDAALAISESYDARTPDAR